MGEEGKGRKEMGVKGRVRGDGRRVKEHYTGKHAHLCKQTHDDKGRGGRRWQ